MNTTTTPVVFDLHKVIAALPDAVDQAMRTTLPDQYTPELAQAIAEEAINLLTGGDRA